MTLALKITAGLLAAAAVAAGSLVGGLALLVSSHERRIAETAEWDD